MSVTLCCPDAPKTVKEDPDVAGALVEVSTLPELNFSNASFAALAGLLGLDPGDGAGCLDEAGIDALVPVCLRLLNSPQARAGAVREPSQSQGVQTRTEGNVTAIYRTARVIDCGMTDQRLARNLAAFLALLREARSTGYRVQWG